MWQNTRGSSGPNIFYLYSQLSSEPIVSLSPTSQQLRIEGKEIHRASTIQLPEEDGLYGNAIHFILLYLQSLDNQNSNGRSTVRICIFEVFQA